MLYDFNKLNLIVSETYPLLDVTQFKDLQPILQK